MTAIVTVIGVVSMAAILLGFHRGIAVTVVYTSLVLACSVVVFLGAPHVGESSIKLTGLYVLAIVLLTYRAHQGIPDVSRWFGRKATRNRDG